MRSPRHAWTATAFVVSLFAHEVVAAAHRAPAAAPENTAPPLRSGAVALRSGSEVSTRKTRRRTTQAIRHRGVWVESAFGVVVVPTPSSVANTMAGVTVGYKWGRFVLAASLDFHYFHWANDDNDTKEDDFSLALGPAVEYVAARKGRLAFHVAGTLQFLLTRSKMERPYGGYSGTALGFDLTAGSGARYYVGGVLGVGVQVGLDMAYLRRSDHNTFRMGPYGVVTTAVVW